jgi:hypothetical protein
MTGTELKVVKIKCTIIFYELKFKEEAIWPLGPFLRASFKRLVRAMLSDLLKIK